MLQRESQHGCRPRARLDLALTLLAASLSACEGVLAGTAPAVLVIDAAIPLPDSEPPGDAQLPACETGGERCNGQCTNLMEDPSNCGTCGTSCPAGQVCRAGACGCPEGYELAQGRCCPVRPGEKTVWCDPFDSFDATLWESWSDFDGATAVHDGALVLERAKSGLIGMKSREPYGYGIYRCRFRVPSGKLEPHTGWAIWQWQNTGNVPTGTFNELDTLEIYGASWDPALPAGGSAGTCYLSNLWIKCPMIANPPSSCKRSKNIYPKQALNDGNWHEFKYTYAASLYEFSIDGVTLRKITDTTLPRPPMSIYAAVNIKSATRPLRLEIDECSYSVEAVVQQ